jgi:RHS repeat-associated protein
MKLTKLMVIAILFFAGNLLSYAQDDPILGMGFMPYGTYQGGNPDSVNLSNGFLNLHISLASVPQRGEIRYAPQVIYMPGSWSTQANCSNQNTCSPFWIYKSGGLRIVLTSPDAFSASQTFFAKGSNTLVYRAGRPDGGIYEMGKTSNGAETLDGTNIWYDGTAYPNVGISRNGHGFANYTYLEDSNGNFLNIPPADDSQIVDTMGRTLPGQGSAGGSQSSDFSGCTGPLPVVAAATYSFPAYGGATQIIKVCSVSMTVQSNFQTTGFFNDLEFPITDRSYSTGAVQSIVIYNGVSWSSSLAWTFEYNDRDLGDSSSINYGSITKMTLPTGGSISYTWRTIPGSCNLNAPTSAARAVASRTVDANDGTGPQKWTYSGGLVTDPLGNATVHTFGLMGSSCNGYETETDYYQGSVASTHLLKTVTTAYRSINDPWNVLTGMSGVTNVFPTVVTTTWPSGKSSRIETDYDNNLSFTVPGVGGPYTGSYGEITETREYDYDGSLLRRTDYTYKAFDGSPMAPSFFAANRLDAIGSITTYDGSGNLVSQVKYGYDEFSLQPSGVTTQLDTATANAGIRGNRTSESHWLNTTNTMLTTSTHYYDTGTPYQVTDPGGHTSTVSYGPGFLSGVNFDGAYITQTQNALLQNNYFDYDFNTGLSTAQKDVNGGVTTESFDLYKRILHKTVPDTGSSQWAYTDSQPPFFTASSPINSSVSYSVEGDLDGLGRPIHSKITSDPSGVDTVDTTYDGLGRAVTGSNSHRTASSPTDGTTTSIYDALGRVKQVTYQDGSFSTIDYSQFPIVTTKDPVGNQHQSRTDGLGRLVEADEPGSHFVPAQPASLAKSGSGSITISGTEQSQQVQTVPATPGSASFTISGSDKQEQAPDCPLHQSCPIFDSGDVHITVNGVNASVSYSHTQNATAAGVAQALTNQINATTGMPVTATLSGSIVTIKSANGTNYGFSLGTDYDTGDFTSPSFTITPSSGTMTGGAPAQFGPSYDTGTVSVILNGTTYSTTTGQTSTPTNIASALAASMNGALVTATASAGVISITANAQGASTDYTLSASSASTLHSFSANASGAALTGGADATPAIPAQTIWSGTAVTLYAYDTLGNLYCVEQHGDATSGTACPATPYGPTASPVQPDPNNAWRRRLFAYDSLSRLRWASNPESGVISYSYDADGNLLQKTSPAPNAPSGSTSTQVISYCYDAGHRVTGKAYSAQTCTNGLLPAGTAVASYFYDQASFNGLAIVNGIGRRTGMTDQAGSEAWSFDPMGRPLFDRRTTAGVTKTTGYVYDFMGNVTSLTYPSQATVAYSYNGANQATSAIDSANSINYATVGLYTPTGALASLTNGTNLNSAFYYNPRLQPCRIAASAGAGTPSTCADLSVGNVIDLAYNFGATGSNNGNVISLANNRNTTRSQSFTYDPLNRIASAQTSSGAGANCFGENFLYDAWGNLLNIGGASGYSGCTQESGLGVGATANNQISTNAYDAAGNTTTGGYIYDAENRLSSAGGVTYTYDGDGKRVEKSSGKLYWFGMGATTLDETDLSGSTANSTFNEYVFFSGKRTARRNSSNTVFYYFADHLGSARTIVQSGQTSLCYDADFYPFGGERLISNSCPQNYKFTGEERDTESDLDYFQFRNYGSSMGRWMIPDPAGMMAVDIGSPQTLNRYAYVLNNPVNLVDLFGLDCAYLNDSGTGVQKEGGLDQQSSKGECGKTGGYWVEGSVTNVTIGGDAETVTLTGTNNGTNSTSATYQQNTTIDVGEFHNTAFNPYNHIALGLHGGPLLGQNPKSDSQFATAFLLHGTTAVVPGAIKPQVGGQLLQMVHISVTGMQAQMIQDSINQSAQNPPPYSVEGQAPHACDCASWAQQVLGDAGINSGPRTPWPDTLMQQLNQQQPQH